MTESEHRVRRPRSAIPAAASSRPWALDPEAVLRAYATDHAGLSADEAAARLRTTGPNRIDDPQRRRSSRILLHQFTSPLIYVLIVALIITLLIQHWADAIVIGTVLLLNATVGFVQEFRAENAMHALLGMVAPKATVRRAGERLEIPSEELVPGDIIILESGDAVPADVRLLEVRNLGLDEATITGESVPVAKQSEALTTDGNVGLPDQRNMAFMGTLVSSGRGTAVVVGTGNQTEIGVIAGEIRRTRRVDTPLQHRMKRFAARLTLAVICASALTFVIGLWRGEPLSTMFLTAVSIAVSAMPEGLPVVMTIALAVSARRMARRHAVIRRLPAVETLGSCTIIVTDKTGTLTENKMTASTVWSAGHRYTLTGESLDTSGRLVENGTAVEPSATAPVTRTLIAGLLDNEADLRHDSASGRLVPLGDPTDVALLMAARKAGLDRKALLDRHPIRESIPFESEHQFSATIHGHDAETLVLIKGAPERVVAMCDAVATDDGTQPIDGRKILDVAHEFAANGLRVLAMAEGRGASAADALLSQPRGFTFLGLVGMFDPPRPSVPHAIARCRDAGLRVIMVTGDHASTAVSIARQIHLIPDDDDDPVAHTGEELDALTDEELSPLLERDAIFARITPEQKLRIVTLLRAAGEVVAVTGDGVNDAPALKAAHIGAAMGQMGTDVAREAGEMILTDDNFATIYSAVEEGRTAFANVRKASFFLISSGIAELIAILASLALGLPLPFLPAQILWLNVVTNGIQDVALAFEPGEPQLLREPPRPLRAGVLSRVLVERTLLVSVLMAASTLFLFHWERQRGAELAYAQVAALTAMVVFQIIHVGNCRSETVSAFRRSVISNPVLLIGSIAALGVHVLAMWTPWTQYLLRLEPLTADTWLTIGVLALPVVLIVELHKMLRRRFPDATPAASGKT